MSVEQWVNAVPPRKGNEIALAVDSTGRAYDTTGLALGGPAPDKANTRSTYVYLQLTAQGGDVYFQFAKDNTVTLNDATVIAVGTTPLAFNDAYCAWIPAGVTVPVRINRSVDKFLHVKTSTGTATLRFNAFSEAI